MPKKSNSFKANGNVKEKPRQWVILLEDQFLQLDPEDNEGPTICKLLHPRTEAGSMFLFNQSCSTVHEISAFKEEFRSWLIDETVQQDGALYIATPVDPVYLTLPYLIRQAKSTSFRTLDDLLEDSNYPEVQKLCKCLTSDDLGQIAEVRGADDFQAYRYSEENTLSWLQKKVENVANHLEAKSAHVTSGAQSATFVQSKKSSITSRDDYIRYAHGLVSDYLPISLSKRLHEHLGIKEPVREKPDFEEPPAKRPKTDAVSPTEDYSQNGKNVVKKSSAKLSAAQKRLSQVDKSGMKSISSFFGKK